LQALPSPGFLSLTRLSTSHHADSSSHDSASVWHGGFSDDPSLFKALAIHSTNITSSLKVILLPMSAVRQVDDNFVVGLLFFCGFGALVFLVGKVRFKWFMRMWFWDLPFSLLS
jgi:hypothetical protein